MKKIFSLIAMLLVSSVCFAQQPYIPIQPALKTSVETKTLTGKVELVTLADAAKNIKSVIVVADDNGNKTTFLVKPATVISDVEQKVIFLSGIKKDDFVKVKYIVTKEGVNEAVSISLKK